MVAEAVGGTAFGQRSRPSPPCALLLAALCFLTPHRSAAQAAPQAAWDPTAGAPPGARYVGEAVCAGCHASEARSAPKTPMGHAAESVSDCPILRDHPRLSVRLGRYLYRITRQGNQSFYSVTDGRQTISLPILWAFGQGEAGQTYIFEWQGAYDQSRVSFFNDTRALDLTLGAQMTHPQSLDEALGDRMSPDEKRACIACHTTGAVTPLRLELPNMVLGVTCEACHGPGGRHVAAIQAGNLKEASIFNPGRLSPGDLDDFCGACHRTWWKVQMMQVRGVNTVRFQPYRLETSHCWSPDDARISCLACHDPHTTVVRRAAFYDPKCLACHSTAAKSTPQRPGKVCPVGTHDCVTCHMPKYELPGGHFKFTDHDIRVVRPGAPYPD